MRFVRSKRRRLLMDMTPMIDVTLQLIIFFMFTSQFVDGSRTPLDLPRQSGSPLAAGEIPALVIDVLGDGTMLVDGEGIERFGLGQQVARAIARAGGEADRVRVLVRADRNARSADVNAIARVLAAQGVRGWQLGTAGETSKAGGVP